LDVIGELDSTAAFEVESSCIFRVNIIEAARAMEVESLGATSCSIVRTADLRLESGSVEVLVIVSRILSIVVSISWRGIPMKEIKEGTSGASSSRSGMQVFFSAIAVVHSNSTKCETAELCEERGSLVLSENHWSEGAGSL